MNIDINKIVIDMRVQEALPKAVLSLGARDLLLLLPFYEGLVVPQSKRDEYWEIATDLLFQRQGIKPCECCWAYVTSRVSDTSDYLLFY